MGNAWRSSRRSSRGPHAWPSCGHRTAPLPPSTWCEPQRGGWASNSSQLQVTQAGDLDHAFETASRDRADAMMVIGSTLFFGLRARIAALALHHRLPAIYNLPSYVHAGGLVAYGSSDTEYYRRAAVYVDKILKGAKPAGICPVEQPTKFELRHQPQDRARRSDLTIPPLLPVPGDRGDPMELVASQEGINGVTSWNPCIAYQSPTRSWRATSSRALARFSRRLKTRVRLLPSWSSSPNARDRTVMPTPQVAIDTATCTSSRHNAQSVAASSKLMSFGDRIFVIGKTNSY